MTERAATAWSGARGGAGRALPGLILAPTLTAFAVFLLVPLGIVLVNSITAAASDGALFASLGNYIDVLGDQYYWGIMLRTLRISVLTTAATLVVGYPLALYLYFSRSRWRSVLLLIVISPLFVSVIVRTYGWIVVLAQNGPLNALLPAGYEVQLLRTEAVVVLGLTHIYLPFMVLPLHAALTKVDRTLLAAGASLGASNLRLFRDILWPLSIPGIFSGCAIVFAISMTAFSTPVLLGGSGNKTMAYLIYQQNVILSNWHLGSALAVVLLVFTLVGIILLRAGAQRASARTIV